MIRGRFVHGVYIMGSSAAGFLHVSFTTKCIFTIGLPGVSARCAWAGRIGGGVLAAASHGGQGTARPVSGGEVAA